MEGEAQRSSGGQTLKGYVMPAYLQEDRVFLHPPHRHTGPVWQVAWAHPKFGHILASCSYDGKVLIWKEQQGQGSAAGWTKINEHTLHTASGMFHPLWSCSFVTYLMAVNSVSWGPHELGAVLACASSDGRLSVLAFKSAWCFIQNKLQ